MKLVITVDCEDPSDLDWLRGRCTAAVEEVVSDAQDEGRLDGAVTTEWETED